MGKFAGWNLVGTFSGIAGNYGTGLLMNHVFDLSLAGCRYSFFLYTLFAIPCLLEADYVLKLWLKNVPDWAVLFCRLQILRTMLEQLTNALGMALMAEGHIMKINIVNLVLSILTFISLYLLYSFGFLPYWHFIISIIFMVIIESCFKIYYCSRYCHLSIKYFIRNVFVRCVLCAVIPFLVGLYFVSEFEGQGFLRLCLTSVICTTILIMVLFSIGMNKQEKNLIVRNMFTNMH